MKKFSIARLWGIIVKEFLQIRRDRMTLGMIAVLPIVQLTLFGFAINTDPKNLKTIVVNTENSEFTRSFIAAAINTGYFNIIQTNASELEAENALKTGNAQFVINIPVNFTERLLRKQQPTILVEVDATDPTTISNALSALNQITQNSLKNDLYKTLHNRSIDQQSFFQISFHKKYNPEGITQYNIIPGLMGVIMSMTMVMMTSLSLTRERERGTLENLLAMPTQSAEVICGKVIPYILVGIIQCTLIIVFIKIMFSIPFEGNIFLVYMVAILLFIANLFVGIAISILARNQLQAMQMTFFYFLPSILLSGFMFPFAAMPVWAQNIGNLLPLTHFNRIIRGVILKGNILSDVLPSIWPLILFQFAMLMVALMLYKKTID